MNVLRADRIALRYASSLLPCGLVTDMLVSLPVKIFWVIPPLSWYAIIVNVLRYWRLIRAYALNMEMTVDSKFNFGFIIAYFALAVHIVGCFWFFFFGRSTVIDPVDSWFSSIGVSVCFAVMVSNSIFSLLRVFIGDRMCVLG